MQRKRVGIIAMERGNIGLDGMRHSIHAGVRGQFFGHGLREVRVDNRHIRRDVEVCERILHTLCIIRDNGERSHLRRRTGGGRNRAETRLGAQRREIEWDAELFKRGVRILIERPHGFRRINRGAAANGDDPVRLELTHCRRAFHNGLDGRIRLNAFKGHNFHACLLQVADNLVKEAKPFHGAAANYDKRLCTLECLKRIERAFSVIKIPWKCKPCHISEPPE